MMVYCLHGILATWNESCDGETDQAENSQETEKAIDEDGDAAATLYVVAEFCDESLRNLLDCGLEFLFMFYPEYFFDEFTRRGELDEQEKQGRGGEECWDCKAVWLEGGQAEHEVRSAVRSHSSVKSSLLWHFERGIVLDNQL